MYTYMGWSGNNLPCLNSYVHRGNVAQYSIWTHTHTHTSFALIDTPKPPWFYFSLSGHWGHILNVASDPLGDPSLPFLLISFFLSSFLCFFFIFVFFILLCLMQFKVNWFQHQMFMFICCFYCNSDTKGSWQKTDERPNVIQMQIFHNYVYIHIVRNAS